MLAIHGGKPVFEKKIGYGHQFIDEDDILAVTDVLRSDYLTCGPKVKELETVICNHTDAKYAVPVSNGTAALHCACIAAGIGLGDEVITTPLTFAASANCVLYCGGTPIFADIDEKTYNIDPKDIEKNITEKTKAVIAVDYTGQAGALGEIREVCEKHGIVFIEDAAHAIGTSYKGKKVGSIADMTCFSFHPVKTVTCGEGGAITTNSEDFYKKLTLAHAHGITRETNLMEEKHDEEPWYYEQVGLGYNYRLTDFQAAMLISQLEKLDRFKKRRQEITDKYNAAFRQISGIILQEEPEDSDTCRHLYTIRVDSEKLKCNRAEFFAAMVAENVGCQVHYIPVYWFPYYQKRGYRRGLCPKAEMVYESIISIPIFPTMTDDDTDKVIEAVRKIVEYYKR